MQTEPNDVTAGQLGVHLELSCDFFFSVCEIVGLSECSQFQSERNHNVLSPSHTGPAGCVHSTTQVKR